MWDEREGLVYNQSMAVTPYKDSGEFIIFLSITSPVIMQSSNDVVHAHSQFLLTASPSSFRIAPFSAFVLHWERRLLNSGWFIV